MSLRFGGIVALEQVSVEVGPREVLGIIGPNGSGKTSLINVISGYYTPTSGQVEFEGRSVIDRRPQELRRLGVSRVFQNLRLFDELTVLENMELAIALDLGTARGVARAVLEAVGGHRQSRLRRRARARAVELLEASRFGALAGRRVGSLSYGQRKELEFLRAIAEPPKLLLLDEPTSGVSHQEAEELKDSLKGWRTRFGCAVVIVEHRLGWLFDAAERVLVLNGGRLIAAGPPRAVAEDPEVRRAYVGG